MRREILSILIIPFILACATGEQAEISIMTYNIHHGEGIDSVYDVRRIGDFIQDEKADIVALQEVDNAYSERSKYENQPAVFQEIPGMNLFYGPNIGDTYGNLTLSRFVIIKCGNISLPNPDNREPRGVIMAEIDIPGHPVAFLNTHLCAFSSANRAAQIERMVQIVAELDRPCIVAGDFNSRISGQLGAFVSSGLLFSTRQMLGLDEGIDDIFVSGQLKSAVTGGNILDRAFSDHPAYSIRMDFSRAIR